MVTAAPSQAEVLLDTAGRSARAAVSSGGPPGIAVGVWHRGSSAQAGYGLADIESGLPVGPTTRFRWCSVTKPVTATLTRVLAAQGVMDLDAPIARTLPLLPLVDSTSRDGLTLRHLLTHTTGFECELNLDLASFGSGDHALERAIGAFGSLRQWAPPGTVWGYCNTGYWLAAHLCALATDESFEQAMRRQVLEPLGMSTAGFDDVSQDSDLALAYQSVGSGSADHEVVPARVFPRCRRGSGGLSGSIEDLMSFAAAHLDPSTAPWPAEVVSDLRSPHVGIGRGTRQLLGWASAALGNEWSVGHDGSWGGFETRLVLVPSQSLAVGVLSNSSGGWSACRDVVDAVLDHLGIHTDHPKPAARLAPDRARFAGRYETSDGPVDVSLTEQGLEVASPGEADRVYLPIASEEFMDKDGERLAFPLPGLIRLDERLGRRAEGRVGEPVG